MLTKGNAIFLMSKKVGFPTLLCKNDKQFQIMYVQWIGLLKASSSPCSFYYQKFSLFGVASRRGHQASKQLPILLHWIHLLPRWVSIELGDNIASYCKLVLTDKTLMFQPSPFGSNQLLWLKIKKCQIKMKPNLLKQNSSSNIEEKFLKCICWKIVILNNHAFCTTFSYYCKCIIK